MLSSSSFNAMPSTGVGVGGEPIKLMIRQPGVLWSIPVVGFWRFFTRGHEVVG